MNTHNPIMAALLAEETVDPKFRAHVAEAAQTDGRFVLCPDCEGSCVVVIAGVPSRWPDGSENDIERPCSTCEGEGFVEVETLPVEVDDGQPSEAQEWADYDRDC